MRRLLAAVAVVVLFGLGATSGRPAGAERFQVRRFALGGPPVAVTTAAGSVFAVVEKSGRALLLRLNTPHGEHLAAYTIGRIGPDFGTAASVGQLAYAAGQYVLRLDLARAGSVRRVALPGDAAALTVGFGSVWIATVGGRGDTLVRLDAATLAKQAQLRLTSQPVALQAGLGAVWLASTVGLWAVGPSSNRLAPAPVAVPPPVGLAVADHRLWVAGQEQVTSLDSRGRVRARIRLSFSPGSLAVTPGRVWVTNNCGCATGRLALFDPRTGQSGSTRVGETPVALTATASTAWLASFADRALWQVTARRLR